VSFACRHDLRGPPAAAEGMEIALTTLDFNRSASGATSDPTSPESFLGRDPREAIPTRPLVEWVAMEWKETQCLSGSCTG
jgi:hypothetical protein